MNNVDDIIFGDFVSNNLSHEEMIEVEKALIHEGDANSTLMASMAFYSTNQELAAELIGDDENNETHNDGNSDDNDSKESESRKQKNMGKEKKFNMASVTAAGAAVSAQKLFDLYKNSQLEYFKNKNVASFEFPENETPNYAYASTEYGKATENIEFDSQTIQAYPDACAFQSQAMILQEYGIDVNQNDLIKIAKEHGWYVEGHGTPHDKIGKLLEYFGVETTTTEGNNIFNLVNELSQGHRILVKVDSGELWAPGLNEKLEDHLILEYSDHALLVVGIDTSDPSDVKVIVTDPGNGKTQYAYTEKEFMDAWKDSKCFMISTNESPDEYWGNTTNEPLTTFGELPYESIVRLSESGIGMVDSKYYHEFFEELKNHPEQLDSLMNDYSNLFEEGDVDL